MSESEPLQLLSGIVSILLGIVGAIVSYYFSKRSAKNEEKTSVRIDRLSSVLKKASSEIEELENEVKNKSKRLQELDDHSKRLEGLLSLKEEQVEAIRQELRATLKENSRSSRIWTILIGAIWFIVGIAVRGILGF